MSAATNRPSALLYRLEVPVLREQDSHLPQPRFLSLKDGTQLLQSLEDAEGLVQSPVQFMAARSGEGTSSIARDLALVCARTLNLRVLLLDLEAPGNRQITWMRAALPSSSGLVLSAGSGWSRDMSQIAAAFALHEVAGSRLHVNQRVLPPLPNSAYWRVIFGVLQEQFDVVVIDSPPLERSFDGVRLSSQVATTVMVVEAEEARSADCQNLRRRIADLGGEIAGCVVNKRHGGLPRWLQRWI